MKIESNIAIKYNTTNYNKYVSAPLKENSIDIKPNFAQYSYPAVYFCGGIDPKQVKNIAGSEKLLKMLNDILKLNISNSELSKEEYMLKAFNKMMKFIKKKIEMQNTIMMQAEELSTNSSLNRQQKFDEGHRLLKELNKVKKMKFNPPKITKEVSDDSPYDFVLLNKLKSALLDGNFNFEKIYKKYYSDLYNIKTLEELKERYPKIQFPQRPEITAAQKIENSLTRDFYEDLSVFFDNKDCDAMKEIIKNKLTPVYKNIFGDKSTEEQHKIYEKISTPIVEIIFKRLDSLKNGNSLSSVPIQRKQRKILSDIEKKLLDIDYDDFVLTVLREQYLNFKKPNEIVYSKDGVNIKVTPEYNFKKIPRDILNIIKEANKIKQSQRNYDIYTTKDFKQRLEFYSDRFDENDEILQKIIDFANCKYTLEDIKMLKLFLRELDAVWDEDKTLTQALNNINYNAIEPKGTKKINELERNKAIEKRKAEQKNFAQLKNVQDKFDDKVNLLYKNNLSYLAEICSDFRPTSLDKKELETADKVIELITKNYDSNTKKFNISKVETDITRWNKYYEYSEIEPDSKKLELAKKYALNNDGTIDTNKAGKYLINAEALDAYPQSIDFARNKDLFKLTVENSGKNPDTIIKNLCKYDDYLDLEDSQKSFIKEILNIFDIKNDLDKNIIKYIIENEYINKDTKNWATLDEKGSKKILATISKKAKHELIDKYKFPQCVEFFEAFEDALTQFATTRGTSGIKHLGRNNKNMKNVYKLKIMGHDDRLIAYNGYYFDEYSPTGFH